MQLSAHLILATALLTPGVPGLAGLNVRPLEAGEREALRSLEDPGLAGLSAGTMLVQDLDDAARDALHDLQSENQALEQQRAGDLDNRTLTTVLLVLGIVLLAIIIF